MLVLLLRAKCFHFLDEHVAIVAVAEGVWALLYLLLHDRLPQLVLLLVELVADLVDVLLVDYVEELLNLSLVVAIVSLGRTGFLEAWLRRNHKCILGHLFTVLLIIL